MAWGHFTMSREVMFGCHNWSQELLLASLEIRGQGFCNRGIGELPTTKKIQSNMSRVQADNDFI